MSRQTVTIDEKFGNLNKKIYNCNRKIKSLKYYAF